MAREAANEEAISISLLLSSCSDYSSFALFFFFLLLLAGSVHGLPQGVHDAPKESRGAARHFPTAACLVYLFNTYPYDLRFIPLFA